MKKLVILVSVLICACSPQKEEPAGSEVSNAIAQEDPLPSWIDGATKDAIISFVDEASNEGTPGFIPPDSRIAVFDNDGTLWSEQPYYFQLQYAIDFIKENSADHPEWSESESIRHILNDDLQSFFGGGEHALLEAIMVSHAGMSAEEFSKSVQEWLATARHPKTGQPYDQMIYQPMLELLNYLRSKNFTTFIVSGGGIDFMRVWAEEAYDIPPYHIVGSSIKAKYDTSGGKPAIIKIPEMNFIDDKEGKPVGIHQHIGMRPVFAVGNSDGDYAMLEYTTTGQGPRLGVLIHHTDSVREFAYDRTSSVGQLERGLDNASANGWVIVDMSDDWSRVYPFD